VAYHLYFDSRTAPDRLRDEMRARYGVEPDRVFVGRLEDIAAQGGSRPMVLITSSDADGPFGWELSAGADLAALTGETELELGRNVCRALQTRALVDDGTAYPDYWFLIVRDGSYGRVMTDPDADDGELRIMHALEPITGEPDLPVVPPPAWAKDW